MSLVLDCSLTLAWYFEDESTPATDGLMRRVALAGAVVPTLWWLEVANGFQNAVRRKRITQEYRDSALHELAAMAIETDGDSVRHAWAATLRLSDRHRLTLYDAAYLEVAARRGLPIATLDRALGEAAAAERVDVLG